MSEKVFHGSPKQGMNLILPQVGTHGKPLVYASINPLVSALFLGRLGGDFTCCMGREEGKLYLVERFEGALEARYRDKKGSIYTLSGEGFYKKNSFWSDEVVSESSVKPISEVKVSNALEYILRRVDSGKIDLYRYPSRPVWIPEDDSDLVERALDWIEIGELDVLRQVERFHSNLLKEILWRLQHDRS